MLHHDSDKLQALISAFESAEQQVHTVLFDTDADDIKGLQVKLNKKLDKVNIGLIKKSMSPPPFLTYIFEKLKCDEFVSCIVRTAKF